MAFIICFRLWPGFDDRFPFDRFELLDDGEAEAALARHAESELKARQHEYVEAIRKRDAERRKSVARAKGQELLRPRAFARPSRFGPNEDTSTTSSLPRFPPLPKACSIGEVLGWWRPGVLMPNGSPVSEIFCVQRFNDSEVAIAALRELQRHFDELAKPQNFKQDAWWWHYFRSRFFIVDQSKVAANRWIALISRLKKFENEHEPGKNAAIAMGYVKEAIGKVVRGLQMQDSPEPPAACAYSPDYRSVKWNGVAYSFTANQAAVIKMLYENYMNGTAEVGVETLLSAVDPEAPPTRLNVLFRDHPAWRTMIVRGSTKGTCKLADIAN